MFVNKKVRNCWWTSVTLPMFNLNGLKAAVSDSFSQEFRLQIKGRRSD